MARDRGPRLVLATGILLGLVYLGYTLALKPSFGVNFRVYRAAADAALHGAPIYEASPPGLPEQYTYLYPPGTVVLFVPFALLPEWTWGYAAFTALSLAACVALTRLLVVVIERHRGELLPLGDRLLIGGYVLASSLSLPSLVYGSVNLLLAFLTAFALAAIEYEAETGRLGERTEALAGVALGVVSLIRVFPALFGAWWLRAREGRALAGTLVTAVVGLALGAVAFGPNTTVHFFTDVLAARLDPHVFAGGLAPTDPYVTIRRPLSVLGVSPERITPVSAAVLAPFVLLYRGPLVDYERLVAILGTLVAAIVFVPALPLYLALAYYPLVPLLYLVKSRPARTLLLLGTLFTSLTFQFDDVQTLLELAPLPAVVNRVAVDAARSILGFATPPLWGAALILLGCLSYRHRGLFGDWRP